GPAARPRRETAQVLPADGSGRTRGPALGRHARADALRAVAGTRPSASRHPPPRLPRIASALLTLAASRETRADVLSDLEDEYHQGARERGSATARRWGWTQVALSLAPLVRSRKGDRVLTTVASDLRYAARLARRAPLVTLSVIVAIG